MIFWSFLPIYLKLMKKKETGTWKAKRQQNSPTITSHSSQYASIKRQHFQSPILFFFSYKRLVFLRFKIFVTENCQWSSRDRFFSYHQRKTNYFDKLCSSHVYCMYIKDVCIHLLSFSCTILSKPCRHSNLLFLHSFFIQFCSSIFLTHLEV